MSEQSRRLKYVCSFGYGDALPKGADLNGSIPVFGSNGQYSTYTESNTDAPVIVIGRKGSYGKINWSESRCFASDTTFFVDFRFTKENLRWLYWGLQTLKLDEGSGEAAVPGLNRETAYEKRLRTPEIDDQITIADFLNEETSRIDELIEAKESMLQLLEQKRAAMISRAVTRGLDPQVPTKPSGLDWLGEVPEHWHVMRLKFLINELTQGSSPVASNTPAEPDELGILKLSAISGGRFIRTENKALRKAGNELHLDSLKAGDVLVTRSNTPLRVGDACMVPIDEPNLLIPDLVYRLRTKEELIHPEFLAHFLITGAARAEIVSDARGSSGTMVKVSQDHVRNWSIPVPPLQEQTETFKFIQEGTSRIDRAAKVIKDSIALLKERRSAVITAAVTGQIPLEEMSA